MRFRGPRTAKEPTLSKKTTRSRRGTDVILHLKEDARENFLEPYTIQNLVRKFSDFWKTQYSLKIRLPKTTKPTKPNRIPKTTKPAKPNRLPKTAKPNGNPNRSTVRRRSGCVQNRKLPRTNTPSFTNRWVMILNLPPRLSTIRVRALRSSRCCCSSPNSSPMILSFTIPNLAPSFMFNGSSFRIIART